MLILSSATRYAVYGDNVNSGILVPSHNSQGSFTFNCESGTNGAKFYKNGSTLLTQFTNSVLGIRNGLLMIGAMPAGNVEAAISLQFPASRNYALATYGNALTTTNISDKYTIDQAAQTILSRQV